MVGYECDVKRASVQNVCPGYSFPHESITSEMWGARFAGVLFE